MPRPFSFRLLTLLSATSLYLLAAVSAPDPALIKARNQQNLQALDAIITRDKPSANSPDSQYKLALAYSYAAEVAMELRDKKRSQSYAVTGLDVAKKAVAGNGSNADYHRLLGAMCGQVIPANPLLGALSYGNCARDEIEKAISLDPKNALAYVSRGVGNYYLPAQMGGGLDPALKDLDKAISLDPKLGDAWLWKGVVLHKANRNAEARQAFTEALKLEPDRIWAKQQLDKTPAQ